MVERQDHTVQVEQRVIAIPVRALDTCGFFQVRDAALSPRRECFFCRYAKFNDQPDAVNPNGYCKFKK
jgi:hypothetical protein